MTVKIRKGTATDALNMTPLIDCVFQLVLFLLLASRFSEDDRELQIDLPTASEAVPMVVQPKEVFINVTRDGQIFLNGQFSTESDVESSLRRAKTNNAHQKVAIRADKQVAFEHVVVVMNVCNRVGIKDYTVAIQGKP